MRTILLLLICVSANAGSTIQSESHTRNILGQIRANAINVVTSCAEGECLITWDEVAGSTVTFQNDRAARQILYAELALIEDRADAGTATLADLKRAIKLIIMLTKLDGR